MRYHRIPDETIRRLPTYLRVLLALQGEGQASVSSRKLADSLGVEPWQIRKDFSYFGGFGKHGVGYDIENLVKHIQRILKLDTVHRTALIGAGNLGSAVLAFPGFGSFNFSIAAVFDSDPKKVGKKVGGLVVEGMAELFSIKDRDIRLGVLAIPGQAAQEVADVLVMCGVKGILNFSPKYLSVPKRVKVISIDIAMDLARLPYYMGPMN